LGYSGRYHAASLVAVFVALAIGILIGAGLGGNVLNDTEKSLRKSLESDLDDARAEGDDLRARLAREQEFEERAYPALVGERLNGKRIGVVALGDISGSVSDDIEQALEPTGGELTSVSVIRTPPDVQALAAQLKGTRFARLAKDPAVLERFGKQISRQIEAGHGGLLDRTREVLFTRSSGDTNVPVDDVILVRTRRENVSGDDAAALRALESGVVEGIAGSPQGSVSVETSTDDNSNVNFFRDRDVATVDNVDQVAGRTAMIFALLGAGGDFGVKDTADRLLPELLAPSSGGGQ
jgi:copper transport outer membrane protein MctB